MGSNGKLTDPLYPDQLQDGSSEFDLSNLSAGHHSSARSNTDSGSPWMNWPPQFFVSAFEAFSKSFDGNACFGDIEVLTRWLYFRKPWNQFSTSARSATCDLLLATLAFEEERSLFLTTSKIDPRRPDALECRETSLLLLDIDAGSGERRPFTVLDSF